MVHVINADDDVEQFMIAPRPSRTGQAWVVSHRGHDIRMYRAPDVEDIPACVVFRYTIHDCWLNDVQ